jgi:hypothetical protein
MLLKQVQIAMQEGTHHDTIVRNAALEAHASVNYLSHSVLLRPAILQIFLLAGVAPHLANLQMV